MPTEKNTHQLPIIITNLGRIKPSSTNSRCGQACVTKGQCTTFYIPAVEQLSRGSAGPPPLLEEAAFPIPERLHRSFRRALTRAALAELQFAGFVTFQAPGFHPKPVSLSPFHTTTILLAISRREHYGSGAGVPEPRPLLLLPSRHKCAKFLAVEAVSRGSDLCSRFTATEEKRHGVLCQRSVSFPARWSAGFKYAVAVIRSGGQRLGKPSFDPPILLIGVSQARIREREVPL